MDRTLRSLTPSGRALTLLGALVLALAVPARAGGESQDESQDDDWLELDNELAAMEQLAAAPEEETLRYGGLVRAFFAYSDADIVTGGGKDVSGFSLNDVDVFAEIEFDRVRARVSGDLSTGDEFQVQDAYGEWEVLEDYVFVRVGRFKPHILRSASMDPERLVFKERTLLGSLLDEWDDGVELKWGWEPWDFYASVTNGPGGQDPHHMYAFRMDWDFYDPWPEPYEGAHGAPIYARWKLGFAWYTESSTPDNTGLGGDAALSLGPWSLHFEYLHLYEGAGGPLTNQRLTTLAFDGDSDPLALTVGWHFLEKWQANLRGQRMDNADDTITYGGSLNYYPGESWYSWTADLMQIDSDVDDGFVAQLGVSFGSTR